MTFFYGAKDIFRQSPFCYFNFLVTSGFIYLNIQSVNFLLWNNLLWYKIAYQGRITVSSFNFSNGSSKHRLVYILKNDIFDTTWSCKAQYVNISFKKRVLQTWFPNCLRSARTNLSFTYPISNFLSYITLQTIKSCKSWTPDLILHCNPLKLRMFVVKCGK